VPNRLFELVGKVEGTGYAAVAAPQLVGAVKSVPAPRFSAMGEIKLIPRIPARN
jgi:hypothetical protein